ncbi:MAG: methyltransferase domain-containing protein [Acidimicrobiia bacterium]|nr:methyltransferase domain-containing protein [Acidimicrobiia bacterium]
MDEPGSDQPLPDPARPAPGRGRDGDPGGRWDPLRALPARVHRGHGRRLAGGVRPTPRRHHRPEGRRTRRRPPSRHPRRRRRCGTGHGASLLGAAFPASTFVGYDLADDTLAAGRVEATDRGLDNVHFEQRDLLALPDDPPFDAVVAFDVIHDQADPAGVLDRIHRALVPGGALVVMDIKAASRLEDNIGNPFAPLLYAVSTLHCTTVSLAQDGAGLGTVWGEELARQMLAEAGFVDVTVHDVPDDPLNQIYVARGATT